MPKKGNAKTVDTMVEDDELDEDPLKIKRVQTEVTDFPEVRNIRTEKMYTRQELESLEILGKKPAKFYDMPIRGLGIKPVKYSTTGLPSVDNDTIQALVNGKLESELIEKQNPDFIFALKKALECWLEMKRIETLMTTFIASLIQSINPRGNR